MSNRRNVITLNGNRYDAVTGHLIDSRPQKPVSKPVTSSSVEGFVSNNLPKKPITKRSSHNISRPTHKSKTLMRRVVNKPTIKKLDSNLKSKPTIQKSISTNPSRELRAKSTNRSTLVSRFGNKVSSSSTKYSNIPIAKAPKVHAEKKEIDINVAKNNSGNPAANSTKNSNLVQNALKNAQSYNSIKTKKLKKSHKLAKKLRVKPGFLNVSMFVLAGLLLAGYFSYNNVPNLAMKVASNRSGINGNVPEYQASGFSFKGPIQYKTGEIKLSYSSNSDKRSYEIIQRNSEWNSDALLSNHVAVNGRTYQILQEKGKTIYIYDGDNASWIENGVWYEINGGEALSANQVIKIANSL